MLLGHCDASLPSNRENSDDDDSAYTVDHPGHRQYVQNISRNHGRAASLDHHVRAGILRTLMFYPLDFSRTRLTADTTPKGQPRPYSSIVSCLRHAWAQEGILSWYKGMGMSLPGVMVYTSISFTAYDAFKVRVFILDQGHNHSQYKSFF
jgi:hypothetical protein